MMWMTMRLALALDRCSNDRAEALLSRICTPVAECWACRRAPQFVAEALECHGGQRLHRRPPDGAPVPRSALEAAVGKRTATSSSMCCARCSASRSTIEVFLTIVGKARGANARLDAFTEDLDAARSGCAGAIRPPHSGDDGLCPAGSLLVRHSSTAVADAFCATRLGGEWGHAFGTLPPGLDTHAIIDRARIKDAEAATRRDGRNRD